MPVVVLVDSGSASSSELLLGALKDNGRALVIGTPTFGKGIGQSVFKHMRNGTELSVTTFKYYTPNGHWAGDDIAVGILFSPIGMSRTRRILSQ